MDVLATNLANADTPNYKARDMEFASTLAGVQTSLRPQRTHRGHMEPAADQSAAALKYRNPFQPSMDGNTVESDLEMSRYAENAVAYQASLMFVNGRISSLRAAITGRAS
jgi:flagellar basal-body rod protein FlgB